MCTETLVGRQRKISKEKG